MQAECEFVILQQTPYKGMYWYMTAAENPQITLRLTRQGSHNCCTSANAPHSLKDILLLEAVHHLLQTTKVR